MSSVATPPPPARLSRAVTRQLLVRDAAYMRSARLADRLFVPEPSMLTAAAPVPPATVLRNPTRIELSVGRLRVGLVLGLISVNSGLAPLSAVLSCVAAPLSRSCQSYVSGSPSGSEPVAVSANGVPVGMV